MSTTKLIKEDKKMPEKWTGEIIGIMHTTVSSLNSWQNP